MNKYRTNPSSGGFFAVSHTVRIDRDEIRLIGLSRLIIAKNADPFNTAIRLAVAILGEEGAQIPKEAGQ